ncbi:MAG: RDD family protein [Bacteroidota bacterium]
MHQESTLHAKADLGKRFIAKLIDSLIAAALGVVVASFSATLGGIAGSVYLLVRDGLEFDFMNQRSIGKHVMGLRVVRLDGAPMDIETSMQRNWMWAVGGLLPATMFANGFLGAAATVILVVVIIGEYYRVVTDPAGRRWGDELAKTQVVEA